MRSALVAAAQHSAAEVSRNSTREAVGAARKAVARATKEAEQGSAALKNRVLRLEAEAEQMQVRKILRRRRQRGWPECAPAALLTRLRTSVHCQLLGSAPIVPQADFCEAISAARETVDSLVEERSRLLEASESASRELAEARAEVGALVARVALLEAEKETEEEKAGGSEREEAQHLREALDRAVEQAARSREEAEAREQRALARAEGLERTVRELEAEVSALDAQLKKVRTDPLLRLSLFIRSPPVWLLATAPMR